MSMKLTELLGFDFSAASFTSAAEGIVLRKTRDQVGRFATKLESLIEKMENSGKKASSTDLEEIYQRFILLAPGEAAPLRRAFSEIRDIRNLAHALNYRKNEKRPSILDGPYISKAIDLIESAESSRCCRILLFLLLFNWSSLSLSSRKLLQESLQRQIQRLETCNRILLFVKKNPQMFLSERGPFLVSLKLLRMPQENLERFFDPERKTSSGEIAEVPLFLSPVTTRDFFAETLLFYIKATLEKKELEQVLPLLLPSIKKHITGVVARRIMIAFILWIDASPEQRIGWKNCIKETALRLVGDPEDAASWGSWAGISPKEEEELSKTRRILNSWISEHLIEVFFDKLIKNKERRDFWFPYARHFTVKILSNDQDYNMIKRDERFTGEIANRLGRLKGSSSNTTGSALVMMTDTYVLIEFSLANNAFYAYKKENLSRYGLAKLAQILEGDEQYPLGIYDIKKTDIANINAKIPEGRFVHKSPWQTTLRGWLKMYLGV